MSGGGERSDGIVGEDGDMIMMSGDRVSRDGFGFRYYNYYSRLPGIHIE